MLVYRQIKQKNIILIRLEKLNHRFIQGQVRHLHINYMIDQTVTKLYFFVLFGDTLTSNDIT
jgi:hypothetical protein